MKKLLEKVKSYIEKMDKRVLSVVVLVTVLFAVYGVRVAISNFLSTIF